jgi:hypothetical protein
LQPRERNSGDRGGLARACDLGELIDQVICLIVEVRIDKATAVRFELTRIRARVFAAQHAS